MTDLIQNMQEVYKKWESKSVPDFNSRGKRRDLQHNTNTRRNYGRSETQFDGYVNYSRPGERRYKQRTKTPYFKLPKFDGLAQFKMAPCVVAENKPRPFMGSCCLKCLPMSRAAVSDKRLFSLSVCNVLHIPHFQSLDFNLVMNVLKTNQKPLYPDVSSNVLKSERVLCAVDNAVEDSEKRNDLKGETVAVLKTVQNNRAKNILESLRTSVSNVCLQLSSFILHYILSRVLDGILVHKGQIEILQTSSQENVPLVYLPVHRSQLDYFLISFILYMNSLKVPIVVTEADLYIPILGYCTKFLGALYIRKFIQCDKNKHDSVQVAVMQSYLTECLKAGHSLEFFIEGGRSRSGKPQMPSSSLLSVVVDSVVEGYVDDAYISTVSISYEKVMEGNFVSEQLGQPKAQETSFSKFYSIWKMLHFNFGNVRLNFSQPFSLKEFIQTYERKLPKLPSADTPPSSPSSSGESNSVHGCLKNTQHRSVASNLAQHIIYDATFSTALMSTQLLAFLLVTQYRKGATQQQLQSSLEWLRGELVNKKRDAGFTGDSLPVIKRAVEFLGKQLISSETIDMEWTSSDLENNNVKVTVYKPVIKLPHVLELQYYANSVVPVFLLDSMIVNALYALVDVEICHFRHCDSKLFVFRDKLIDKAIELSEMLQFEFIVIPPCSDIVFSFSDVLDELIEKDCLHVAGVGIMSGRTQYIGKSHALSFDASDGDEDDDESPFIKEQQLKIDLSEESINQLELLRNVLSPYIESYWLAAITLLKLIDEIKEEKVFIQEMQLTAQEKLYKGLLAYEESFSADTFKNALKLFEHWCIVEYYMQDGIKIVYLNDSYNCKERINDIIARIEEFRK